MKIVKLEISNYMGVKAVEITPTGNVVLITGANGQGKTSVLNALWAALQGGDASRAIKQQVRDGEKQASVTVDLGEYIVTRRWLKNGVGELEVATPRGATYDSPQSKLDGLVAKLAMDPLAFQKMDAKKQVETLIKMLGDSLSFDPVELEKSRAEADANRAQANKDVKALKARLAAAPEYPGSTPATEIPAADLFAEHAAAITQNAAVDDLIRAANNARQHVDESSNKIDRLQTAIDEAKAELVDAVQASALAVAARDAAEPVDVSEITRMLASLEETNREVRGFQARKAIVDELEIAEADAKRYDDELEAIKKEKADGFAAAKFPNAALTFDENGVLYNGRPFDQASGKERRIAGLDLARKMNPELRVIRIDEGESLDTAAMADITAWAEAYDYQLWVTCVSEGGEGFVIRDGMVAA